MQPRWGVRRVHVRLRKEGESFNRINHKRVQRVMSVYSLQVVRRRKSRKTIRTGNAVPGQAQYPNHVWTVDFQEDALLGGGKIHLLNVLDEFTREWLAVSVGKSAEAGVVTAALAPLFAERGAPTYLRSDNGGQFVAEQVKAFLVGQQVASYFIDPGRPWQNGYVESFHSRLRDELLNREVFATLAEARIRLEEQRAFYNRERPHSALGYLTPEAFRQDWEQRQAVEENDRTDWRD